MAGLDREPLVPERGRHDGMAACRLCASTDAAADHAWCAASEGLVCDECCRHVLLGDVWRLKPLMSPDEIADRAEVIICACLACERGQRWYAEQLQAHFSGGPGPN